MDSVTNTCFCNEDLKKKILSKFPGAHTGLLPRTRSNVCSTEVLVVFVCGFFFFYYYFEEEEEKVNKINWKGQRSPNILSTKEPQPIFEIEISILKRWSSRGLIKLKLFRCCQGYTSLPPLTFPKSQFNLLCCHLSRSFSLPPLHTFSPLLNEQRQAKKGRIIFWQLDVFCCLEVGG